MSPRFSIRPLSTLGDRRLAELAADGDERAFETLIGRHRVALERYCWRLGLPDHHAEDVLQQAFTKAWLALRRGSDVGQPRAWLYRIVHNAALNAHRSARLRMHESIDAPVAGSLALAGTDDAETRLQALDALREVAALPDMQRQAVVMTAIEGRSHEEAAGELGVSDDAVRGLLHRARTKLRAAAAAFTPQGLAELLARVSSGGTAAERPLEAGAGAVGAGLAGVLAKGAAVTAVAGLLAGGAVTQLEHRGAQARPAATRAHAAAGLPARPQAGTSHDGSHAPRGDARNHGRRAGDGRRGRDELRRGEDRSRGRDGGGSSERTGVQGEDRTSGRSESSSGGPSGDSGGTTTVEDRTTQQRSGGGSPDGGSSSSGSSSSGESSDPMAGSGSAAPALVSEHSAELSSDGRGGSGSGGSDGSLDSSGGR